MNFIDRHAVTAAYTLPFALYVVLTQIPNKAPGFYPQLYTAALCLTAFAMIYFLCRVRTFSIHKNILPGIFTGLAGIFLWIVLCRLSLETYIIDLLPESLQPEKRSAFNPFEAIESDAARYAFIGIRMAGLAVVVPIAEELFWRGFLMRFLLSSEWESQPIGRFTLSSFLWVTALFTLAHPEWFAAAVYCLLINGLIYWKKDLWNCIVAHGVSNLVLGIYVLYTGNMQLW